MYLILVTGHARFTKRTPLCSVSQPMLHNSDMLHITYNSPLKTQILSVCYFLSDSTDDKFLLSETGFPRPNADWSFSGSSSQEGEGSHCLKLTHIVVLFAPGIIKFGTRGNKYCSEPDLKGKFNFCLSAKTFRGPDLRRGPALEKQRDRCRRMMSAAFSPLPKIPLIPWTTTEAAWGHKSEAEICHCTTATFF